MKKIKNLILIMSLLTFNYVFSLSEEGDLKDGLKQLDNATFTLLIENIDEYSQDDIIAPASYWRIRFRKVREIIQQVSPGYSIEDANSNEIRSERMTKFMMGIRKIVRSIRDERLQE